MRLARTPVAPALPRRIMNGSPGDATPGAGRGILKRWTFVVLLAGLLGTTATSQKASDAPQLPTLYKIQHITLSPSYSCRSKEEFRRKGYEGTALYLSGYSEELRSPELLFNGACKSADNFEGALAGDALDVIADYGDVALESLTGNHV